MRLYLIRHSESANNALLSGTGNESDRTPDPEITQRGQHQGRHLAEHLHDSQAESRRKPASAPSGDEFGFGVNHLYCSLMTRSILTADYIAQRTGLRAVAHPEIFERGGLYEEDDGGLRIGVAGPGRSYFVERFPDLVVPADMDETGWYRREAEADDVFCRRVENALEDIIERHQATADHVALVVHGDFIDQSLNYLMGLERKSANYDDAWMGNWAMHNTSITRIDISGAARVVVYTNRVDHLPHELVSW